MAGLGLGTKVPAFVAISQLGSIHSEELLRGSWALLVSVAADFDPVATTEMGMLAKLIEEFEAREIKVLVIAKDSLARHRSWISSIEDTQTTKVTFPILVDEDAALLGKLGMRYSRNGQLGHVLPCITIVDPDGLVQFHSCYPSSSGRNFYEVLRAFDAIQLTYFFQVGTPADWVAGEDVFVLSSVPPDVAAKLYPKGVTTLPPLKEGLPSCRITAYPDLDSTPAAAGAPDML